MARTPYSLEATETIAASADEVYTVMNDFARFEEWSPFFKMDPTTQSVISEPAAGIGATYSYSAKRMGSGKLTIEESERPHRIRVHINFGAPQPSVADVEYLISESDGTTTVTWRMTGKRGFGERLMVKVLKMDQMMAKHFAEGLGYLKAVVEKR